MNIQAVKEKAGAAGTASGLGIANEICSASSHTPTSDHRPSIIKPVEVKAERSDLGTSLLPPDERINEVGTPDGADLLTRVIQFASRFIVYPSQSAAVAHTLWIAHTHLMDAWFSTPRLAVLSPEPGSGKSRVLEITSLLVPRPIIAAVSSAAFVIRSIADQENRPTVLLDEVDTIFGPRAKGNEDLRGAINSGYRRGSTVGRCKIVKDVIATESLPIYGAVALGGLGDLPSTIMSRSIVISMRQRSQGETVEPFRPVLHEAAGMALSDELALWANGVQSQAELLDPLLPEGIEDRNADVWSPILAVAELAGGVWPERARAAACEFVNSSKASRRPSLGVQLLADIKRCFGTKDRLPTAQLIAELLLDEEGPWGDIRGRKLNPRELASMLRVYGISSTSIRMPDGTTPKGYRREQFEDSWRRYLPALENPATPATADTAVEKSRETAVSGVADSPEQSATVAHRGYFAEICGGSVARRDATLLQ